MPPQAADYIPMRAVTLPWLGITYLSEAVLRTKRSHRPHQHAELQVLWGLSGTVMVEVADASFPLSAGHACVLPRGVMHSVIAQGTGRSDVRLIDLRIAQDEENALYRYVRTLGPGPEFVTRATDVELAVRRFAEGAGLADASLRAPNVLSAVWQLLGTIVPQPGRDVSMTPPMYTATDSLPPAVERDARLDLADGYCRQRLSNPISVDEVAAAVGLSRSQLTRLYLQGHAVGPAQRLRQLRCDLARHLLATTSLSIKEIAACCGFAQPNHFGRVFQQVTGVKPTEFRAGERR